MLGLHVLLPLCLYSGHKDTALCSVSCVCFSHVHYDSDNYSIVVLLFSIAVQFNNKLMDATRNCIVYLKLCMLDN